MKKANFSDMFNKIHANHGKELEKLRKDALTKQIIIIAIVIIMEIFIIKTIGTSAGDVSIITLLLMMLIPVAGILLANSASRTYVKNYKNKAINVLVRNYDSSFKYEPSAGISSMDYNMSNFDRSWDKYFSEDYVEGSLDESTKFKMSQVHTKEIREYRDSDGHYRREEVTTFLGLYGIIKLPVSSNGKIDITPNSNFRKFSEKRVEMESSEFEKHYDVLAQDRLWAMQIINSESIENLVEIRNNFKKAIQIRIVDNKMYFRLSCGDLFEPPKFRSSLNFDLLLKYFRIIDIPRMIYEAVIDNIAVNLNDSKLKKERIISKMSEEEKLEYEKRLEEERKLQEKKEEESWFST